MEPVNLRSKMLRQLRAPLAFTLVILLLLYCLFPSTANVKPYTPPSENWRYNEEIQSSIVVPAYHERLNMRPLVTSIFKALPVPALTEVVIVDDNSNDGTQAEIEKLQKEGFEVVLVIRKKAKGLSGAVLRGLELARGGKIVIMDADLQHPPTSIPAMLKALDHASMVLGTRYGTGSISSAWPWYRRVISWGARLLARPLTSTSDPMTGFFGITKKQFLQSSNLNPSGFKIALELMLKSQITEVLPEVPFAFASRVEGNSKLGPKVMLKYVGQLLSLYLWKCGKSFPLMLFGIIFVLSIVSFRMFDAAWLLINRKTNSRYNRNLRHGERYKFKSDA